MTLHIRHPTLMPSRKSSRRTSCQLLPKIGMIVRIFCRAMRFTSFYASPKSQASIYLGSSSSRGTPWVDVGCFYIRASKLRKEYRSRRPLGFCVDIGASSHRHVYVPVDHGTRVHFTRTQLHKLHRQFFHPSADKLFKLLEKARPEHTTKETLQILKEISMRCDPC
eukprot:IDg669t1